jgi:GR25 family glycosyltransferase involved in LPS biosynthesis
MDNIDAILYINLEHRKDRQFHIINELNKLNIDNSKIHRIDAIKREKGAIGCGLSHIKALEYILEHPEWNTVLVLEDDFTFKSRNTTAIHQTLNIFLQYIPSNYDMGILSYNHYNCNLKETSHPNIKKINYTQTTSSYIIKRHYIPTLMANFKDAVSRLENEGVIGINCIDISWTKLQPTGNWYAICPAIGYQFDSYSDIENRVVKYGC